MILMLLSHHVAKLELLVGVHIMDSIKILTEVYFSRVIGDSGIWIILFLAHNYDKPVSLIVIKFMNSINILDNVYLPQVIG